MDGANIIRRRCFDAVPLWIDGHLQSAQLSALLGRRSWAGASLDRAIATQPRERSLWLARCELGVRREAFDEVKDVVARADAAGVAGAELDF